MRVYQDFIQEPLIRVEADRHDCSKGLMGYPSAIRMSETHLVSSCFSNADAHLHAPAGAQDPLDPHKVRPPCTWDDAEVQELVQAALPSFPHERPHRLS